MSITVNGQSRVPPGFRFHPTEEELLSYYLKKKVACERIDLDVIRDVDLNKLEPWDIQEKCRIGSTPQNDWYFFSHKDKKYPTGTRTNRATAAGFWKATGRDKVIHGGFRRIGMRKTLVFYKGRAPHGQKSDWIMHEYRLDDDHHHHHDHVHLFPASDEGGGIMGGQEDGWVVCRVFKKKNHIHKNADSPSSNSSVVVDDIAGVDVFMKSSSSDGALDHLLAYMGGGRPCKQESGDANCCFNAGHGFSSSSGEASLIMNAGAVAGLHERFMMKLPPLESSPAPAYQSPEEDIGIHAVVGTAAAALSSTAFGDLVINDWAALDRLVASHLNGGGDVGAAAEFDGDGDLWSFTRPPAAASN